MCYCHVADMSSRDELGRSPSVKRAKPVDSSIEEDTQTPVRPAISNSKSTSKKCKVGIDDKPEALITDFFQKNSMMANLGETEGSSVLEDDCSNKDIMCVLMSMKSELMSVNSKLDAVNRVVEKLEGDILTLKVENDELRDNVSRLQKRDAQTQERLEEAILTARLAREHADRNEQYSRRNNIKLMFVEESTETVESAEDSEKIALKIFHEKLKLRDIKSADIEIAHRVGKKKDGVIRPIVVKFVSRKTKMKVMKGRRLLKGSNPKIVIFEDLAKGTYQLYQHVSNHSAVQDSWTWEGKVFATDTKGKVHNVQRLADLDKLPPPLISDRDSTGKRSSTPNHADRRPPPRRRKPSGFLESSPV